MPNKPVPNTVDASKYPRHNLEKSLRIPRAILDQNAGKTCRDKEAASFVGVSCNGPFRVEISSGIKFGLLNRPTPGHVAVTDLAKKILRPQSPSDETAGLRQAFLGSPVISDVYQHYRGENLPDRKFFENALVDTFKVPSEKLAEFSEIFVSSLDTAKLADRANDKVRLIDVSGDTGQTSEAADRIKKLGKAAGISSSDSCFVMMPFANPVGRYYELIYEPAIKKAGLVPVRADADIFGTGRIMEQIWRGINAAKVLVAELTDRNPNVFYELGLAHALKRPVVLVSSNEHDVPFDLQHIRVIYYDTTDPFWGTKLIDKVAENILSAVKNPQEAIFERVVEESTR